MGRPALEQALTNPLTNALKHAPGRPIDVEVACDGATATVAVRDHNEGIPPSGRRGCSSASSAATAAASAWA